MGTKVFVYNEEGENVDVLVKAIQKKRHSRISENPSYCTWNQLKKI